MKLLDWLAREKMTRIEFARRVGVAPQTMTGLCRGYHWLGREVARAIERETNGEVTAADFVHLGGETATNHPGKAA